MSEGEPGLLQRGRRLAQRLLSWSWFRYLVTGGVLFIVDLAIFLSLVRLAGVDTRLAQGLSRTAGALLGFFLHRCFSFRATGGRAALSWSGQGAAYLAVTVWNILISPWVVYVLVRLMGGWLTPAKVVAEIFLVCETYLLLRFVFRVRKEER